ncbi:2-alkenal reductase NADP+-dependent-like protein [Cinnamomum micranthum f. kanehirae]|uniref:2-alkenal reductase NADP+-dependent-like protein n=1 Tax=Cinnamomum micranthum f. kanehirae TaxID=337451 RepID=A0A443Q4I4_9MAGN|nr:2-alkenal reductase NADP+-dependent-like protein [Cinnamomum micranthum f. kanehirae]
MKKLSSSQSAINFATRLLPGQGIDAYGIGKVVASANPDFEKDDIVVGLLGWEEYSVVRSAFFLRKIDSTEFPLSYHAGLLELYVTVFNTHITECWSQIWKSKGEAQEAVKKESIDSLKPLEGELEDKPFYDGKSLEYVDVVLVPFVFWFYTYETDNNFSIENECPMLIALVKSCMQKESVSKVLPNPHKVYDFVGLSGLTAYAGFYNVCKPKKGEKVFVSAASGSVGNVVGQLAKLFGCYVVGCAGSKKKVLYKKGSKDPASLGLVKIGPKVDLLKDKLGFDDAFNYKEESDLKSTLKRYFPEGIDIYFDNVGSEMQEAAVANMNAFGRVAVCGVISEYTDQAKRFGPDMLDVVYKRITIQGFLAADHMHVFPDFISTTSDHLRQGQMHALEDISEGLESIPSAFAGLFRGDNVGKKLVRVSED